jgi:hypothetical protein
MRCTASNENLIIKVRWLGSTTSTGRQRNGNQCCALMGMHKLPFPYVTITTDELGKTKNVASVGEAAEASWNLGLSRMARNSKQQSRLASMLLTAKALVRSAGTSSSTPPKWPVST